jgi:subtilisin family serine protease
MAFFIFIFKLPSLECQNLSKAFSNKTCNMKNIFFAAALLVFLSSCRKDNIDTDIQEPVQLKTPAEIDAYIFKQLKETDQFEWSSAPFDIRWSALQQKDQVLSLGYRTPAMKDVEEHLHEIDIQSAEWMAVKNELLDLIYREEMKTDASLKKEQLIVYQENVLPVMNVRIKNPETLRKLLSHTLVRYAEPMAYEPAPMPVDNAVQSSSGCGSNTPNYGLQATLDYTAQLPDCKASWNYPYHNIVNAWTRSTGSGIKVFIIDTGTSPDQDNLGSAFNQGSSSGRTVEKIVTLPQTTLLGIPTGSPETPADGCGHGTAMAGACLAPRGIDGNAVGVAYNANLIGCRAAADVYLDESREIKGVADAFVNAGNRTDVRVISMSMGRVGSVTQISDAVKYAYKKGKLIFCAGGTSTSATSWTGVVFPATMTEVNAVTGVKTDLVNRCSSCHEGSQIDFTVVMEKTGGGTSSPITLAMSSNTPGNVGGSSVATATTAGMAALVWSKYPSWTRDQVLSRLISSSSNYPTKSSTKGWGRIDAMKATF